jgi:hypothetical protein
MESRPCFWDAIGCIYELGRCYELFAYLGVLIIYGEANLPNLQSR